MRTIKKQVARGAAWLLSLCLILPFCCPPAAAQRRRAIIINAEQPNVWTLEQAHYLLAQMHRRNLDLKASGLGELNPNEINGLNFDVMRTLIEFGVSFDDAARFNNSLLTRDQRFDADRAIRLQTRRDQLADQSLALNRDIARLGRERALVEPQETKDMLAAQIAELTAVRDANNAEVTRLDNDLKTATGPTGEVQATDAPAPTGANRLPQSTFDDAFKGVTKSLIDRFNEAPKLNASLRLDNFLQMQYEIIAKQLTLLRDEVGPGERIIFLELPQTVNAAYDKANKKWAQSWWKVVGYTIPNLKPKSADVRYKVQRTGSEPPQVTTQQVILDALQAFKGTQETSYRMPGREDMVHPCASPGARVTFLELDCEAERRKYPGLTLPEDRSVRTVELIPRQSSLNVNDIKLRARTGVLTAVVKTLFGIGARLNVQRQRETFSQFVQQELYSSGFGKGAREFGWTFTPMPGTDRVMSGARTTYAVMVVPNEAEALVMQTTGCYFPRAEYQPNDFANTDDDRWTDEHRQSRNCSEHKSFIVPIPGGGEKENYDFRVKSLYYVPAEKGDRVVLSILGSNFPAQLGMLVDGVPLTQSIGVAQPLIRDDSAAFAQASVELKDARVSGRIERIDSEQIVAVFERPNGKDGTQPVITLTAPGNAVILNDLFLEINGTRRTLNDALPLFGKKPPDKESFRIDKVEVYRSRTDENLTALVTGAGFAGGQHVFVNGSRADVRVESAELLTAEFSVPSDEKIRLSLIRSDDPNTPGNEEKTIHFDAISNPALLRIANVEVVTYEPATENETATIVVKITGSGFTDALTPSIGDLAVKSTTEAILKLKNPEAAVTVTLTDSRTNQQVKTIVTRKTQPPK